MGIQRVFKKRPNFCYKDFILQHFKHCPLQSSPLYWRYTVPVSSIVGKLPDSYGLICLKVQTRLNFRNLKLCKLSPTQLKRISDVEMTYLKGPEVFLWGMEV